MLFKFFYDNFLSAAGGLYWTQYYSSNGPDEYININAPPGTYDVYIFRHTEIETKRKELFTPVKVTVYKDYAKESEEKSDYYISIPAKAGFYKVTSIDIEDN